MEALQMIPANSLQKSKEEMYSPVHEFRNAVSVPNKHVIDKIHMDATNESEINLKINELLSKENGLLCCTVCGKTGTDIRNIKRQIETHIEAGPQYRSVKARKPQITGFPLKMPRERHGF